MESLPEYCAVIRTLGTAGEKYQTLLDSLVSQTHPPKRIIVYLAEGYEKPKESVGIEQIIYVKKGMVAQRALQYDEVDTEWMLVLDDDISIEPWGAEKMLSDMISAGGDVCAFDAFPHHKLPLKQKIAMAVLLSSIPRLFGKNKGYTVNFLGMDCYNPNPPDDYAWSTTNSCNGFFVRKKDFLNLHFEEELWLDRTPYALPDDKVMFYKMHLRGLKILTHFNSGFTHLDAGSASNASNREEKIRRLNYSLTHNFLIFDELYVKPNLSKPKRIFRSIVTPYRKLISAIYNAYGRRNGSFFPDEHVRGIRDAKTYLESLNRYDS